MWGGVNEIEVWRGVFGELIEGEWAIGCVLEKIWKAYF